MKFKARETNRCKTKPVKIDKSKKAKRRDMQNQKSSHQPRLRFQLKEIKVNQHQLKPNCAQLKVRSPIYCSS